MSQSEQLRKLQNFLFDGKQKNLADAIGKSPAQLNQWLNGYRNLSDGMALQIERTLGLPWGWLNSSDKVPLSLLDENRPSENLSDGIADDRIRFERLDVVAALGDGYINNEAVEVVDFVHVDKAWAREKLGGNLSSIQVITARGDSMQGTIEDGDVLFVDTSVHSFEGEGIYLLSFADGLKAKRLQASVGGGLLVISDNPRYRTETVEGGRLADLTICGRVRGAWHLSTL